MQSMRRTVGAAVPQIGAAEVDVDRRGLSRCTLEKPANQAVPEKRTVLPAGPGGATA